jgi:thiosulfate/3-mercaptopyruvate sulfurtransferase
LALGLEIAGMLEPKLYDGSWSEWGSRDDLPIVTGD